ERRGRGREWLSRPGCLARHIRLRNGPLFDRPQMFSRHPVKNIQKAEFCGLGNHIDLLASVQHREQCGRSCGIVIPKVVMNELEIPQPLAGSCVERQKTIAIEISAVAVSAV